MSSRSKTIAGLGEFEIIRRIVGRSRHNVGELKYGVGDDTSVLRFQRRDCLVTTDLLQEDVHFRAEWTTWHSVGWKSLAVNISDIAAMGGVPRYYWVSLGLPKHMPVKDLNALAHGMRTAATSQKMLCAGGDTNRSPKGVVINVMVLGHAPKKIPYRNAARIGDDIYVSGRLGESALGLAWLRRRRQLPPELRRYVRRHQRPPLRVAPARRLVAGGVVNAMIDVSDGLLADLTHILDASAVGAELTAAALPVGPGFQKICERLGLKPHDLILGGGEDYELLFTARPAAAARIAAIARTERLSLSKIGQITKKRGLICFDETGRRLRGIKPGYNHFHD